MSAVIHSVRAIRNAALESNLSLREQSPAERDEMRRSESVSESIKSLITPLTARQMHAINLLAMGKTVVATARSLDIGVSTLHRWKATHPLFKAELAQRQHNLFDAMIQKLRLTMSKAVDNLFEMMNSTMKSERKEVTHAMLKLLRPQKFLVPSEPMSAEAVLDEAVREMRASRGESMSEEITDEERIAAIPEEFLVREEIKHQGHGGHEGNAGREEYGTHAEETESRAKKRHVERSETSGASERRPATSKSVHTHSGQILREYAQDDGGRDERGVGEHRHAERSETSGATERETSSTRDSSSARQASTPLPSREGAASDEKEREDDGVGDAAAALSRITRTARPADASKPNLAGVSRAQSNLETAIASRPLPQPLPRGEGSEEGSLANRSATAMSESATVKPGQIFREYAQDDGESAEDDAACNSRASNRSTSST